MPTKKQTALGAVASVAMAGGGYQAGHEIGEEEGFAAGVGIVATQVGFEEAKAAFEKPGSACTLFGLKPDGGRQFGCADTDEARRLAAYESLTGNKVAIVTLSAEDLNR